MRRNAATSAIQLIRRGIWAKCCHEFGNSIHPFSFFISSLHISGHKDRRSSPKPRIDLSSINDADDAICLFRKIIRMRPHPSVTVYNKLFGIIVRMKHYSVALSVFDEMRQTGAPVNEYTFNIAINCYCLLNRLDLGLAILGIILKSVYKPDATTFGTLIKGLFLDHKVTEALKLFKKLLVLKTCEPSDVMILTVINGLCKAGQTTRAFELLHNLEKTRWKPNICAYTTLIEGLCKGGMVDDALQLLPKMVDKGISPDVLTYNILVDAYCKQGRMNDVEDVLEDMMQQNICPDIVTYNTLIEGYCVEGDMNRAWHLFLDVPSKGLERDIFTYNTTIHGLLNKGRYDDAWKLFNEMKARQVHPNLRTYNIMLDGFKSGEIPQALSFLHTMEDEGFIPDIVTYGTLINGLCRDGEHEVARDLFNELPSKGLQPTIQIYTTIAGSLCQEGSVEEAKVLVVKMEESGCPPNSCTYNVVIQSLLRINELSEAIPFLEEMCERGFSANVTTMSLLLDQMQGQHGNDMLMKTIQKVDPKYIQTRNSNAAQEPDD
ncbi:hypothetical protein ACS0TY_026266 [Phlomoides rotata]